MPESPSLFQPTSFKSFDMTSSHEASLVAAADAITEAVRAKFQPPASCTLGSASTADLADSTASLAVALSKLLADTVVVTPSDGVHASSAGAFMQASTVINPSVAPTPMPSAPMPSEFAAAPMPSMPMPSELASLFASASGKPPASLTGSGAPPSGFPNWPSGLLWCRAPRTLSEEYKPENDNVFWLLAVRSVVEVQ
ncbi:hypothetical protein E2562_034659 [Oryza meyeriana var. granulata]|uniref:Uncharacterized protein n=1 Tax=Oryza meyeriana var. granulata TaxID=110450 RepID=A0A6G1ECV2_9ORYZ|nr:hypothetical protein E2562_034659 [Oryza meyeriana var. granulata]